MKVSLFIHSLAGGGAERVVSQLVTYLQQKNVNVYLVLMSDIFAYDIPEDINITYLEKTQLDESGLIKLIKLPLLAYRYHTFLKREGITVSLSFLNRPNYVNILSKLMGTSTTVIISERSSPSAQYGGSSAHSKINSYIIKKLFIKSDGIIANSKGNRLDLIHNFGIPEDLIVTIPNPIDINKVLDSPEDKDIYDKRYFNFISVGRLNRDKNHELLIRSLAQTENKSVRLYIFGSGELHKFLEALIIELQLQNQVFLKGFTKKIFTYLKGADAFLFGSNHEGFPNVLIEAMACGLPIITTNCQSGPAEIMKCSVQNHSDKNVITDFGILVPVNNIIQMTNAIIEMVHNSDYRNLCKRQVIKRANDFRKEHILEQYFKHISKYISS